MLLKLVLIGTLAVGGAPPAAPASVWTQDGHGPGNNGWNPYEKVVTARTVGGLKPRWSIDSGPEQGSCGRAGTPPVVANGRVFVIDYATHGIAAYHAKNGKRLWLYHSPSFAALRLAVTGNRLIAVAPPCRPGQAGGSRVVALDVRTGAVRWQQSTGLHLHTFVVTAGTVVAATYDGTGPDPAAGSVAFRTADGRPLWERADVLAGPVSAGGLVLLADRVARRWTAVAVATGRRDWHTGIEATAEAADPAGARFYLSDTRDLRAVDSASGRPLWRIRGVAGPVCDDGRRLYLSGGVPGVGVGVVSAWEPGTGRRLWWRGLDGIQRMVRAADLLLVGSADQVAILSPQDGATVAPAGHLAPMNNHPVVAGGKLYITDRTALRVYAP